MCRDFTFIDTVIEACIRVLTQPARACQSWRAQAPVANHSTAPFVLYNIGSGVPVRLLDFIETQRTWLVKR